MIYYCNLITLRSKVHLAAHLDSAPFDANLDDDATTSDATDTLAPPALLLLLFFCKPFCSDCNGSGGAFRYLLGRLYLCNVCAMLRLCAQCLGLYAQCFGLYAQCNAWDCMRNALVCMRNVYAAIWICAESAQFFDCGVHNHICF